MKSPGAGAWVTVSQPTRSGTVTGGSCFSLRRVTLDIRVHDGDSRRRVPARACLRGNRGTRDMRGVLYGRHLEGARQGGGRGQEPSQSKTGERGEQKGGKGKREARQSVVTLTDRN